MVEPVVNPASCLPGMMQAELSSFVQEECEDMRKSFALFARNGTCARPNLIQINGGTFYREHPSAPGTESSKTNPPLFSDLNFELPATLVKDVGIPTRKNEHWAVIASNDGTTFLEILRGLHLCFPPSARSFPYLASEEIDKKDHRLRMPSRAIQYVGFNSGKGQGSGGGIRGAYLSARYESHREETDWSVLQYLRGETELNPSETHDGQQVDNSLLEQVIKDLRLQKLVDMPVSNLSNGQTRRSRIAKALLGKPELLLLDEPFMGLDPPTLVSLSPILRDLAYRSSPLLLLALRPQDPIPDWITHLAILGNHHTVSLMGSKAQVLFSLHRWADIFSKQASNGKCSRLDEHMAEQMSRTYGPPLTGVGDTLSAKGITRYLSSNRFAINKEAGYFDDEGLVRPENLSSEDREKWHHAKDKSSSTRSPQDLMTLTSTLPADFKTEQAIELESSTQPLREIVADARPQVAATEQRALGDPLIELKSVVVKYGEKTVLGYPPPQPGRSEPGLNITIRQGTRLALLGPNGSGKTTLLSLLTSDHPHSYSLPIQFFGRSRLPSPGQPGLSLWEIQSRIGHSAPEVHAFFPKRLSVRRVLESAWSETYSSKPKLTYGRDELVDGFLRWWEPELRQNVPPPAEKLKSKPYRDKEANAIRTMVEQSYPPFLPSTSRWGDDDIAALDLERDKNLSWAEDTDQHAFGFLPFGTQRLLLFLRALIKTPDILILDEAFSGLSSEVREKAMCWLEHGERMFLQRRLVNDMEGSKSPTARWEVTTVPNYRSDVLRIADRLDLDVNQLMRGRKRKQQYYDARQLSHDELLDLSMKVRSEATRISASSEPFQGLSDQQAMVVVSHVKEEIPPIVDEWLRLPGEEEVLETGRGAEMGRCDDGSIRTAEGWNRVWGF